MAELVIHGVPNGEQISNCDDKTRKFIGLFYNGSKGVQTKVSRRPNNDVIYSYLIYGDDKANFVDYGGRAGSYFGMSLVFHNEYVPDSNQVFNLLKSTYDNYVKNKIIQEFPNGARKWMYRQISTPGDEIANYIGRGMMQLLKTHPELRIKTQALPPLQNQNQRY